MHYHVVVLLGPDEEQTKETMEAKMAPHEESYIEPLDDSEEGTLSGYWDWWRIGGRWDGTLYPEIGEDPACVCESDFHCGYSGLHEKTERNFRPVADLKEGIEKRIHGIVTPDGQWVQGEEVWNSPEFVSWEDAGYKELRDRLETNWHCKVRKLLVEHNACVAVSVDIHS